MAPRLSGPHGSAILAPRPLVAGKEAHRDDGRGGYPPRDIAPELVRRARAHPADLADARGLLEDRRLREAATVRIDERRHARVGDADHEPAVLDRAVLREREVDRRLGRFAEPRVVGD